MNSIENFLEINGSLTYTHKGKSMLPLLREGKDIFTLTKKNKSRCKVGDVVLYRRPPKIYVLHRIIEVRENDYVILGDNCIAKEYGITDKNILGVMSSFTRNGREYTTDDIRYKIYTFIILHTITIRIFLKKILIFTKRKIFKWTKKNI